MSTAYRWAVGLFVFAAVGAWTARAQIVTLPAGTELQISLETRLNTKESKAGDPFRARIVLPVFAEEQEAIPAGTIVEGTVARVQGPGRVSGKAEMQLRPEKITLPNGDSMPLTAAVTAGSGDDNTKVNPDSEGAIQASGKGDGPGVRSVGTAVSTGTIMGAVIGDQAGAAGTGALIGAGAVAAAVLLHHLFKRGNDAELPAGSELILQLNRPLQFNPTMQEVAPGSVDEAPPSRRMRLEERRPELTRDRPDSTN